MPEQHSDGDADSPYQGRWVARLQGKIVAHGGTPEAARRAARANRHKETPEVTFMRPTISLVFSPLVLQVERNAGDRQVFLVGGAMRDVLLGRVSHDFDFATKDDAIGLARRVAAAVDGDFYVLDEAFDAARVITSSATGEREVLDFSAFRGKDLDADLTGRDFTINAIAFDLRDHTVHDPLNGSSDIRAHTLRACSSTAIRDDPIRILRAVRLAAALDFKIDAPTRIQMKAAVGQLPDISTERKRDELFKILGSRRVDSALRALEILGVFPFLLPELPALKAVEQSAPHVHDVWEHTLSVLQNLERILGTLLREKANDIANGLQAGLLSGKLGRYRSQLAAHLMRDLTPERTLQSLLYMAVLYHDVSKPATRSVEQDGRIRFLGHEGAGALVVAERCRELALSNDECARVRLIVANHMRFSALARRRETAGEAPSRRAIYRLFRDAGDAGPDLVLLGLADLRGTMGHTLTDASWSAFLDVARILLENYWERPEETVAPRRLLDGHDAMREFGISQGRAVGDVLQAIREAQATGEVTSREQALAFGREWLMNRPV